MEPQLGWDHSDTQQIEAFAAEICKYKVFMTPHIVEYRNKLYLQAERKKAYREVAKALNIANLRDVMNKIRSFRRICVSKVLRLVRARQIDGRNPKRALDDAPVWLKHLDAPWNLLDSALCVKPETSLNGRRIRFTWDMYQSVVRSVKSARTMEDATKILNGYDAVKNYAVVTGLPVETLHGIWIRIYNQSLYKLESLVRNVDETTFPLRFSELEWRVVDLAILYDTHTTVINKDSFNEPEIKLLMLLFKLISVTQTKNEYKEENSQQRENEHNIEPEHNETESDKEHTATEQPLKPDKKDSLIIGEKSSIATNSNLESYNSLATSSIQVEEFATCSIIKSLETAPSHSKLDSTNPKNQMGNESATVWALVLSEYMRRAHVESLVLLQKRWYELKQLAREQLLAAFQHKDQKIHPLLLAIIKRFPYLVTSPLPTWWELVQSGQILTEEHIGDKLHDLQTHDERVLTDIPVDISTNHLLTELLDWSDDEPEIIEPNKDIIDLVSDSDTETDKDITKKPVNSNMKSEATKLCDSDKLVESDIKFSPVPPSTPLLLDKTDGNNSQSIIAIPKDAIVSEKGLFPATPLTETMILDKSLQINAPSLSALSIQPSVSINTIVNNSQSATVPSNDMLILSKPSERNDKHSLVQTTEHMPLDKFVESQIKSLVTKSTEQLKFYTLGNNMKSEAAVQSKTLALDKQVQSNVRSIAEPSSELLRFHELDSNIKTETEPLGKITTDVNNIIKDNSTLCVEDSIMKLNRLDPNKSKCRLIFEDESDFEDIDSFDCNEELSNVVNDEANLSINKNNIDKQISNEFSIRNFTGEHVTEYNSFFSNINKKVANYCDTTPINISGTPYSSKCDKVPYLEINADLTITSIVKSPVSMSENFPKDKSDNLHSLNDINKEGLPSCRLKSSLILDDNRDILHNSQSYSDNVDHEVKSFSNSNTKTSNLNKNKLCSKINDLMNALENTHIIKIESDEKLWENMRRSNTVNAAQVDESCHKSIDNQKDHSNSSEFKSNIYLSENFHDDSCIEGSDSICMQDVDEKLTQITRIVITPLENISLWRTMAKGDTINCRRFSVKNFTKSPNVTFEQLLTCRKYLRPLKQYPVVYRRKRIHTISSEKIKEFAELPVPNRDLWIHFTKYLKLSKTFLSANFWSNKHNLRSLNLCKPVTVSLQRAVLSRVAKKVELADIDEVRRINKTILTAQVAPINKADNPSSSANSANIKDTSVDSGLPLLADQHESDQRNRGDYLPNEVELRNMIKHLTPGSIKVLKENKQTEEGKKKKKKAYYSLSRQLGNDIRDIVKVLPKYQLVKHKPQQSKKTKPKRKKNNTEVQDDTLEVESQPLPDAYQEWQRQKTQNLKYFNFPLWKPSSSNPKQKLTSQTATQSIKSDHEKNLNNEKGYTSINNTESKINVGKTNIDNFNISSDEDSLIICEDFGKFADDTDEKSPETGSLKRLVSEQPSDRLKKRLKLSPKDHISTLVNIKTNDLQSGGNKDDCLQKEMVMGIDNANTDNNQERNVNDSKESTEINNILDRKHNKNPDIKTITCINSSTVRSQASTSPKKIVYFVNNNEEVDRQKSENVASTTCLTMTSRLVNNDSNSVPVQFNKTSPIYYSLQSERANSKELPILKVTSGPSLNSVLRNTSPPPLVPISGLYLNRLSSVISKNGRCVSETNVANSNFKTHKSISTIATKTGNDDISKVNKRLRMNNSQKTVINDVLATPDGNEQSSVSNDDAANELINIESSPSETASKLLNEAPSSATETIPIIASVTSLAEPLQNRRMPVQSTIVSTKNEIDKDNKNNVEKDFIVIPLDNKSIGNIKIHPFSSDTTSLVKTNRQEVLNLFNQNKAALSHKINPLFNDLSLFEEEKISKDFFFNSLTKQKGIVKKNPYDQPIEITKNKLNTMLNEFLVATDNKGNVNSIAKKKSEAVKTGDGHIIKKNRKNNTTRTPVDEPHNSVLRDISLINKKKTKTFVAVNKNIGSDLDLSDNEEEGTVMPIITEVASLAYMTTSKNDNKNIFNHNCSAVSELSHTSLAAVGPPKLSDVDLVDGISTSNVIRIGTNTCQNIGTSRLGTASVNLQTYINAISGVSPPLLKVNSVQNYWIIDDTYVLVTDTNITYMRPIYLTTEARKYIESYTKLVFPADEAGGRPTAEKSFKNYLTCRCRTAKCFLCTNIETFTESADLEAKSLNLERVCSSCRSTRIFDDGKVLEISGSYYRKLRNTPLTYVRLSSTDFACIVCGNGLQSETEIVNGTIYKKLSDRPPLYARVMTVVHTPRVCKTLTGVGAKLYLFNLRCSSYVPLHYTVINSTVNFRTAASESSAIIEKISLLVNGTIPFKQ